MRRFLSIVAAIVVAFSFCACDKVSDRDTDREINRPGNNGGNHGDNGGSTDDPELNTPDDGIDRSGYEVIENTNYVYAGGFLYGQYFEDQPENINDWILYLEEDDVTEESGYSIEIELFTSSSAVNAIPTGKYTIAAFDNNPFAEFSLLCGDYELSEDENEVLDYWGTWLFEGHYFVGGATAGEVNFSKNSNGTHSITYTLHDDIDEITFKGSYSGEVIFSDERQANYSQAKSQRRSPACKSASPLKLKVRR